MLWKSIEPTGGSTTPKAHFASNWNQIARLCGTYPLAKGTVAAVENFFGQKRSAVNPESFRAVSYWMHGILAVVILRIHIAGWRYARGQKLAGRDAV
jgi:hypothetical protein